MNARIAIAGSVMLAALLATRSTAPAAVPDPGGPEAQCASKGARLGAATVRIPWSLVGVAPSGIEVRYCVARGDANARLAFERDAEIVYFVLATSGNQPRRANVSFTVRTSTGRVLQQGPVTITIAPNGGPSCRIEACQFFTEPGESVVQVGVRMSRLNSLNTEERYVGGQ